MASDDERPAAKQRYPTLVSFYKADPVRLSSRERDVGLWWRSSGDGPIHRAAWIEETGELYLVRLAAASDGGGAVEVIGRARDGEELERALSGWREHCGMPGSLQWLRMRAARLALRARPGAPRIAAGGAGAALV
ncbi:MAG TPA: hypothetical protein VNV44_09925 [Solirubrobacteraceae bacterium]|jgi:hypothetical protein|nr:hypothetical protein [Solirubrobacteraceae bacterium]